MSNSTAENLLPGFLSSVDIAYEIKKGASSQIEISKNEGQISENDPQITHVGYDVSLGGGRKPFDLTSCKFLEIKGLEDSRYIEVKPGHTISVETEESIKLGHGMGALVESKVRMVSKGFSHISTTIDPTWCGKLLLTFTNHSGKNLRIDLGTPIATLVFFRFISPAVGRADVNDKHNQETWRNYADVAARAHRLRKVLIAIPVVLVTILLLLLGWYYLLPVKWQEVIKLYDGLSEGRKSVVNGILGGVGASLVVAIAAILLKFVSKIFRYLMFETIRK